MTEQCYWSTMQLLKFTGVLLHLSCCMASQTEVLWNNVDSLTKDFFTGHSEGNSNVRGAQGFLKSAGGIPESEFPQKVKLDVETAALRVKRGAKRGCSQRERRKNRRKQQQDDKHTLIQVEQRDGASENIPENLRISLHQTLPNVCPMWPKDSRLIVNCTNGRHVGSRCFVRCPPGYQLSAAKKSRRCRATKRVTQDKNGQMVRQLTWTGKDRSYQCVSACPTLKAPANGEIKCKPSPRDDLSNSNAQLCETTCHPGFTLSHDGVRRCQQDGNWSGEAATCQAVPKTSISQQFVPLQALTCGDVTSLTTYSRKGTTYLVAGDTESNVVRIFKWSGLKFAAAPWQTLEHQKPQSVQVVPSRGGNLWLFVVNASGKTVYKLDRKEKFRSTHFMPTPEGATVNASKHLTGIDLLTMRGDIFRCTNRRKGRRSIVLIQKLVTKSGQRSTFKRFARRRMREREFVADCAMLPVEQAMLIVMASNRPDGRGRILVGRSKQRRIRIAEVLKHRDLRNVSDVSGFRTPHGGGVYLAAAQRVSGGQCFIYKRMDVTVER